MKGFALPAFLLVLVTLACAGSTATESPRMPTIDVLEAARLTMDAGASPTTAPQLPTDTPVPIATTWIGVINCPECGDLQLTL